MLCIEPNQRQEREGYGSFFMHIVLGLSTNTLPCKQRLYRCANQSSDTSYSNQVLCNHRHYSYSENYCLPLLQHALVKKLADSKGTVGIYAHTKKMDIYTLEGWVWRHVGTSDMDYIYSSFAFRLFISAFV